MQTGSKLLAQLQQDIPAGLFQCADGTFLKFGGRFFSGGNDSGRFFLCISDNSGGFFAGGGDNFCRGSKAKKRRGKWLITLIKTVLTI